MSASRFNPATPNHSTILAPSSPANIIMDLDPNPSAPTPPNPATSFSPNPAAELEFDFQSLNLSHKEVIEIDFEEQEQEQIDTSFSLLFKVGPPEGTAPSPRNISLFVFERAMKAAWGTRFYKVEQLAFNLFVAYFRSQDDLRWVWQKQPWLVDRETMLVEFVDPNRSRPKEAYTFRYLPVNIHLYGVPKPLRSVDLVEKIIEKIGVKDSSVPLSENAMFKVSEYIFARVILDVSKPLLDSVAISISKEKKIKVFIHYEKIVKICNFCGYLFHNVSSCPKRHEFIMNLSPTEAAKVPEEIYGRWRSLEFEIPLEAREEKDSRSHNAYIQSFKDFFQKSSGPLAGSGARDQPRDVDEIFSRNSSNLQTVVAPNQQQSAFNATGTHSSSTSQHVLESHGQASQFQNSHCSSDTEPQQTFVGFLGPHSQQGRTHYQSWQGQNPFSSSSQWQHYSNPFVFQGSSKQVMQNSTNQNTGQDKQDNKNAPSFSLPGPTTLQSARPLVQHSNPNMAGDHSQLYSFPSSALKNIHSSASESSHTALKTRRFRESKTHHQSSREQQHNPSMIHACKRKGTPLSVPSPKKFVSFNTTSLTSSPLLHLSTHANYFVEKQEGHTLKPRKKDGNRTSRWDMEHDNENNNKNLHVPILSDVKAQADGGTFRSEVSHGKNMADPRYEANEQEIQDTKLQEEMDISIIQNEGEGYSFPTARKDNVFSEATGNASMVYNQPMAENHQVNSQVQAVPVGDQVQPDAAVCDDGAMAPALKAPQAP